MNETISVYYKQDCYVITYSAEVIKRITKFAGESETPFTVTFEHLPEPLQNLIIKKILNGTTNT